MNIPGYDAWKLSPPDDGDMIGTEEGETCNRYPEPDEDQPRGYRPRRCRGMMVRDEYDTWCDTCGELA